MLRLRWEWVVVGCKKNRPTMGGTGTLKNGAGIGYYLFFLL